MARHEAMTQHYKAFAGARQANEQEVVAVRREAETEIESQRGQYAQSVPALAEEIERRLGIGGSA